MIWVQQVIWRAARAAACLQLMARVSFLPCQQGESKANLDGLLWHRNVNFPEHQEPQVEIPGGHSGCVTLALVNEFLWRLGKDAMAQQATQLIEQARALPVPQAFPVSAEMT